MSDFAYTMEKRLEELCKLPQRQNNYDLTEDGRTAGEDMDINQATLEAVNSARSVVPGFKPSEDLYDLVGEPEYVIDEFKFVRDVLMELPETVLVALCKQRGWRVLRRA